MLAKSKLNSIETQAVEDLEISHEKFKRIVNEKKNTKK